VSRENVELIERIIESWNAGDVDAVYNAVTPDAVFYAFPEWPDDPVYRGVEGWKKLLAEFTENFDDLQWEIKDLIDLGDRVIALVLHHARIKNTGIPLTQPIGALFGDFHNDRSGLAHFFLTWDEVLAFAGADQRPRG
jgi:ketosteroid isomerase-like protein